MPHRPVSIITIVAVSVVAWWGCCAIGSEMDNDLAIVTAAIHCPTAHLTMNSGHQAATVSETTVLSSVFVVTVDQRFVHQTPFIRAIRLDQVLRPERDVGVTAFGDRFPELIATVQPRAPSRPDLLG